jgi:4'-phosphopantetheinyl transferase
MGTTAAHPWPAHAWPIEADKVLAALRQGQCAVIYRILPRGTPRHEARGTIRLALREALALWLDCPADGVALSAHAGTPLRIEHPSTTAQVSISHEDGLSVAAIHPYRTIGVDVLAADSPPWTNECLTLARDYLAPQTTSQLAALPAAQSIAAFGTAWTQWEAGLKSCGLGLSEWTSVLQNSVDCCDIAWLELPKGYCGAVALHPGKAPGRSNKVSSTMPAVVGYQGLLRTQ